MTLTSSLQRNQTNIQRPRDHSKAMHELLPAAKRLHQKIDGSETDRLFSASHSESWKCTAFCWFGGHTRCFLAGTIYCCFIDFVVDFFTRQIVVGTEGGSIEIFEASAAGAIATEFVWTHAFFEHTHSVSKLAWNMCDAGSPIAQLIHSIHHCDSCCFIFLERTEYSVDWLASCSKDTVGQELYF
jgi:hypothetical protein